MKICFVVNECSFFYSHRFQLAKKLASFTEISLLTDTSGTKSDVIQKINECNIYIHEVPRRTSKKGILGSYYYFKRLLHSIRLIKPDNIFFVTLEISFFGVIVSWFYRKVFCFYLITGLGPFFFNQTIKNKLVNLFLKTIFISSRKRKNCKFIFQNNDNKEAFVKNNFISENQSIVIPGSGIELDEINFKERNGKNPLSFLFASRLVKSKGISEFIEAGKIIKDIYPEVILNIAGKFDPSDPEKISDTLFQYIQDSTIFNYLGDMSYDEMQLHYLDSDIFILPSYAEGLPKSALEAAASGMPLILSKTSGCKECVVEDNNGFLVEIKDISSIKVAMEKIIANPNLIPQMSQNSRKLIKNKFSLKLIFNSYKKLVS